MFVIPTIAKEIAKAGIRFGFKYGGQKSFERVYKYGGYSRRTGRAVYKGYLAGTTAGSVGAGLRDAFTGDVSPSDEPSASKQRKTRSRMEKPYSGRFKYNRCRPRYRG